MSLTFFRLASTKLVGYSTDVSYNRLVFWAEWLASLRHLSLKATNFAKPTTISDRKLNSKKIGSVWISFRFNHFLAIWLAAYL